jgi:ubiquinone/menaquinone biosynthesis C-methylase UbiE
MSPKTEKPDQFAKIEAVLRRHPGVRAAKVSRENFGPDELIVYVVPHDEYVRVALTDTDEERKRIQKWRKTFDLMQMGKEAAAAEPGFNIAGWNSSYTRQPIPAQDMREWVENTVAEITSLRPQELLEIGCGTGLLLLRIAPRCKRYVATDFAPAVLAKLRKQMEEMGRSWDGVDLMERTADNFEGVTERAFDTVVINSVTQHFPNVSYLTKVMDRVVRTLKPGGKIFIGDVRSLPLLETYSASVELYQARPEMELAELRERVAQRVRQQEQLVISPAFFLALAERNPRLSGAEIRLKRGHSDNELTRFRYDVVLHADGGRYASNEMDWLDWAAKEKGIENIRQMLNDEKPESVAIASIRNTRVERDVKALERISDLGVEGTAGELRKELEATDTNGINPEDLHATGEELGYRVELSWASCRPSGSYDAVLSRTDRPTPRQNPVKWPHLSTIGEELAKYTNVPGQNILRERLVQQLLSYSKENLRAELVPQAVVIVDALP